MKLYFRDIEEDAALVYINGTIASVVVSAISDPERFISFRLFLKIRFKIRRQSRISFLILGNI